MSDEQQSPIDGRSLTSALNGAQSQGPVTPEGKARSSRNNQKHGMHSRAIVLHFESAEAYETLRQQYHAEFSPANQSQADLVDEMVAARWRLRRLASMETAALDHAVDAQREHIDATYTDLDTETRAHLAFDKINTSSSTMNAYNRFQASQIRAYDRALRNLCLLQSKISQVEPK